MSAAEKLRALAPVHLTVKAGAEDPYAVGAITLYNVPLPQIVALVEAAHQLAWSVGVRSEILPGALHAEGLITREALAALDRALTVDGKE